MATHIGGINREKQCSNLRNFFNKVEKETGCIVNIAAHPGYDGSSYPDEFGKRLTIVDKTMEMVGRSNFVMTHCSTALGFAVFLRKPIIFLTLNPDEELVVEKDPSIEHMASWFGKVPINIEDYPIDIDWEKEGVEAVERLREMIRFATVNPPGDEKELVEWLAGTLRQEGLEPEVIVSEGARANLAVTVKGDGSERPLLLLSHLDVVPVETERWTSPPFAGELRDGFVYGRGAIDSKLTGAVQLQVLLMCHRLGLSLKRDLVLVAAADEERGGVYGVEWLATMG